jgi:hypothetical protein
VTIDIDGTIVTTGQTVERAFRGYNPHHRKNPSYYPILGHVAQTGQIITHKNRSGDVHDSKGSAAFIRETVRVLRKDIGFTKTIEIRTDGAFFQRELLELYARLGVEYATKVPMWPWLNLRAHILKHAESDWMTVDRSADVEGIDLSIELRPWNRRERIAIFRKRVNHRPVKGLQLDLFNPDDGYWEYCAVATNRSIGLPALWHFINGRGAQEKTISELKGALAFDAVISRSYSANTAWQKINVLTHNLAVAFQLAGGAPERARSRKRTAVFRAQSLRTLRFEWLNRAGRIINRAGRRVLRLPTNVALEKSLAQLLEFMPKPGSCISS